MMFFIAANSGLTTNTSLMHQQLATYNLEPLLAKALLGLDLAGIPTVKMEMSNLEFHAFLLYNTNAP